MWAAGCEIDFVVNLERFASPVVSHFVFQANPVVPGTTDVSFAFHIEVATGVGKPDDAASAGAKQDQAVTAQRVNVDPKCEFALYCRPPAAPLAQEAKVSAFSMETHPPVGSFMQWRDDTTLPSRGL